MVDATTIWNLVWMTTLWCCGVYLNSDKGGIFYPLNLVTRKAGWIGKPIIQCINCMPSLHTVAVMALYGIHGPFWEMVKLWALVAIPCTFTTGLVYSAHEVFQGFVEHLKPPEKPDKDFYKKNL